MIGCFKNTAITGLAEASDDGGELSMPPAGEPEDDGITADDINAMSDDDLDELAKAETDIDPDDVDTYDELKKMLIAELCD